MAKADAKLLEYAAQAVKTFEASEEAAIELSPTERLQLAVQDAPRLAKEGDHERRSVASRLAAHRDLARLRKAFRRKTGKLRRPIPKWVMRIVFRLAGPESPLSHRVSEPLSCGFRWKAGERPTVGQGPFFTDAVEGDGRVCPYVGFTYPREALAAIDACMSDLVAWFDKRRYLDIDPSKPGRVGEFEDRSLRWFLRERYHLDAAQINALGKLCPELRLVPRSRTAHLNAVARVDRSVRSPKPVP